jgi:hypothetical protein
MVAEADGATLGQVIEQEPQGRLAVCQCRLPQVLTVEIEQIEDVVDEALALPALELLLECREA